MRSLGALWALVAIGWIGPSAAGNPPVFGSIPLSEFPSPAPSTIGEVRREGGLEGESLLMASLPSPTTEVFQRSRTLPEPPLGPIEESDPGEQDLSPRSPSLFEEEPPRLAVSTWVKPFDPNVPDFESMPDRWQIKAPPFEMNDPPLHPTLDPYHQNRLKGDYPFLGDDLFHVFTLTSQSLFESREVPIPSNVSSEEPGSFPFFGEDRQDFFNQNFRLSLDLYRGQTSFRPPTWRFRYTHVFNYNDLSVQERGVVHPDVRKGTHRDRNDNAIEELFLEMLLFECDPKYDFTSARVGIQPFVSDFRGFVFNDTNLGYRLFGSLDNNKTQWNLAWFDQLEKETNSELNTFESRGQQVLIANMYRQDFIWLGYNAQISFHANLDDPSFKFDRNGFLVRPDPIGSFERHEIDAYYFGWAGEGHIGEVNVSHQFYQVVGNDSLNPISGRDQEIDAQLFALEFSIDRDWFRPKMSFLYQSGDADPTDSRAKGFDGILENPNFAGGPFSFWGRQALRFSGTGVGLVQRNSPYADLSSSKLQGQSNYVNPGLILLNAGFDVDWTPRLKTFFNANYLRFDHTEPIELVLQQPGVDEEIGWDLSLGFQYRPYFTNNIIFTGGVSTLIPGGGFKEIATRDDLYAGFLEVVFTY